VGYLDPFRVGRGFGGVIVVPVPPFVGRGLRRAFGRILPVLLAAERGEIEIAPRGPHRLVAAIVDEVGAEYAPTFADEHVMAMPFVHAEILVEIVGDRDP